MPKSQSLAQRVRKFGRGCRLAIDEDRALRELFPDESLTFFIPMEDPPVAMVIQEVLNCLIQLQKEENKHMDFTSYALKLKIGKSKQWVNAIVWLNYTPQEQE